MVIVEFSLKSSENEFFNTAKSSFNKRHDKWVIEHVQMYLPSHSSIVNRLGRIPLIYRDRAERMAEDVVSDWIRITLPVSERYVIQKRSELHLHQYVTWSDYKRLWRDRYCEKALLKTAMSCSNIVAYLLGYPDYYSVDPDDLFERLQQYR